MSNLSGLELRSAACEALGIRVEHREPIWRIIRLPLHEQRRYSFKKTARDDLPAIESDPAVSEPMFLEWCEKNGYRYIMRSHWSNGDTWLQLKPATDTTTEHGLNAICTVAGATPSEARARCIVEASKK